MVVLEFAFQNLSHFIGCLIFLLCICWAIANFSLIKIEKNYSIPSEFLKGESTNEEEE